MRQIILVLLILVAIGIVSTHLRQSVALINLPLICRHLPPDVKEADRRFDRRVQTRFSYPIYVTELVGMLKKEGFAPDESYKPPTALTSLKVERAVFPCKQRWIINWDARTDGTAANIEGHYFFDCP
jgi:hypothetical protein